MSDCAFLASVHKTSVESSVNALKVMAHVTQVLQNETDTATVKINPLWQNAHTEVTADAAAELEAFNTHSQFEEQAQDDGHHHEPLSSNNASTKAKEELSFAEGEVEAGCLKPVQQNKVSKE